MPLPIKDAVPVDAADASGGLRLHRYIPLALILLATVVVFASGLQRYLTLEALVHHRMTIDTFVYSHAPLAVAIYIGLYVAVVALSIPGAAILTISGGLLFGTIVGGSAAICGATIGATIIFLVARTALGEWLFRGAGPLAAKLAAGFREEAFSCLLFLRLIPLFPFWLVNLVAALAGVSLMPFIVATAIGIIPLAYLGAYLGAGLDTILAEQIGAYNVCRAIGRSDCRLDINLSDIATPQMIAALCVLCLFVLAPVIIRRVRSLGH
ncbi:MAG: TVP38/TMEM64 family protein [Xanthobacteraceae bacterium]